jgi:DNA-binding transcriptional LysR family regulator
VEQGRVVSHSIRTHIEVDSIRAQLELVKLGSGIGRFPKMFVNKHLENKTLIQVLPKIDIPALQIFALYPNAKFVPAPTRCFLDYISGEEGLNIRR